MSAEIRHYSTPKYLYRYRSLGGKHRLDQEISSITDRYIYCSTFDKMNDPMEGLFRPGRSVRRNPEWDQYSSMIRDGKFEQGIASFSEAHDHELMWAHYAAKFEGICIEYDFEVLRQGLPNTTTFTRVSYAEKLPEVVDMMDGAEQAKAILSTKNHRWAYEREWRMFAAGTGRKRHLGNPVTSVYMGYRISDEDRAELVSLTAGTGARVHQMIVDGYSIVFERL